MLPAEGKVSKILNIAVPTTKKQVRALLGLIGFYRRYVESFSSVVEPLIELTKKKSPSKVKWTNACQKAFDEVKRILSQKPVLQLPDFAKQFVLRTDASGVGIGGVLMQAGDDGCLHPVLYASR